MLIPHASPQQLPWVSVLAAFLLVAAILVGLGDGKPGPVAPDRPWPHATPAHVKAFVNGVMFAGPCRVCGLPGAGPTREWTLCDKHRVPNMDPGIYAVRNVTRAEYEKLKLELAQSTFVPKVVSAEEMMAREEYRTDFGKDRP